jgi:hypothetical protein
MITVYCLIDPRNESIRYIGQTSGTIKQRLFSHISRARSGTTTPALGEWLLSLDNEGLTPKTQSLEEHDTQEEADGAEARLIEHYRAQPDGLLNQASGRKSGFHHSEESKALMSVSHTGKVLTPEQCEKIGDAHRGKPKSAEWKAKVSAANKGQVMTDLQRAKLSAAKTGSTRSEETKKKISDSMKLIKAAIPPKEHCKLGHPLSGDNLYTNPKGHSICRECQQVARKRYQVAMI